MNLIKFEPVLHKKIWGSESWLISAHENGMSIIKNGEYKGMSLKDFFNKHKDLLGVDQNLNEFPLLVKEINAIDDLSVQVHPNDKYAKEHENSLGKDECWYILDAINTDIIIGQKTGSKEEMAKVIQENKVMENLNIMNVNKGDFFNIPSGVVHAIRKNTKILEIQQSSDITYRLYDYNRKDADGNTRELHIDKSLDVIDYNYEHKNDLKTIVDNNDYKEEVLTNSDKFIVKKITIKNKYTLKTDDKYILGISLSNNLENSEGFLNENESFLMLKNKEVEFKSKGELIISTSKN